METGGIIYNIMIELLNTLLLAFIGILLGMLGAYFTNWEQNIYFEYLKYIVPPIGIVAFLFLFINQELALVLLGIFLMGISWYYSTKVWFRKR